MRNMRADASSLTAPVTHAAAMLAFSIRSRLRCSATATRASRSSAPDDLETILFPRSLLIHRSVRPTSPLVNSEKKGYGARMPKKPIAFIGRPPEVAPAGHVTVSEAAELAEVSYAVAYRHVQDDVVRYRQEKNGTIFIVRADVSKIRPRPRLRKHDAEDPRITIRVKADRLRRWEALAGDRSVTSWLCEMADRAVSRAEKLAE